MSSLIEELEQAAWRIRCSRTDPRTCHARNEDKEPCGGCRLAAALLARAERVREMLANAAKHSHGWNACLDTITGPLDPIAPAVEK